MPNKQKTENFMRQFRDKTHHELLEVSAPQLLMIWNHYDRDGNGFIEGWELDKFLREFVSSVCQSDVGPEVVSETMLTELKKEFLDAYDENGDGKIEIRELAVMLPTDENCLLLFQLDSKLNSSVDFMKIWKAYDADGSGFIEANELKNFLKDLMDKTKHPCSDEKIEEFTNAIIAIFDENKDGKLQLSEMASKEFTAVTYYQQVVDEVLNPEKFKNKSILYSRFSGAHNSNPVVVAPNIPAAMEYVMNKSHKYVFVSYALDLFYIRSTYCDIVTVLDTVLPVVWVTMYTRPQLDVKVKPEAYKLINEELNRLQAKYYPSALCGHNADHHHDQFDVSLSLAQMQSAFWLLLAAGCCGLLFVFAEKVKSKWQNRGSR